jgi:hypothetical protein
MRAKMARALVLSVAGAAAVAAAVVPASAATSPAWRIVKTFGPAEGVWSDNFAVSGAHDAWSTWIACKPCSGNNQATLFYVEHSAGTTWRKVRVPASLEGAAEASVAIGASSYRNAWFFEPAIPSNAPHAHVLRWNGSRWHRQAIPSWAMHPNLSGSYDIVPAVFGPRSVWVFSMGVDAFTNPDHYVARYNGHSWTKLQMPAVPSQVSVLSEHDIWALGYTVATTAKPSKSILMHWNGKRWSTLAVQSVHVPKNSVEFVLNPVALGPANVWIQRDIEKGSAGATTLYLLHWNGRHWARVALAAGISIVDFLTQDGHGGLWAAANGPKPSYSPRLYHLNGKWTRYRVPAVKGTTAGTLTGISWIPGTRSVWATGNLFQRGTNGGIIGDILKHAG